MKRKKILSYLCDNSDRFPFFSIHFPDIRGNFERKMSYWKILVALLFILIYPSRDPRKKLRITRADSSRILDAIMEISLPTFLPRRYAETVFVDWKLARSNEDGFVDRTSYSGQLLRRLGTKRSHVDSASFSAGYRRNSSDPERNKVEIRLSSVPSIPEYECYLFETFSDF